MPLLEEDAPRDPLALFERWYREVQKAGGSQPEAMALATSCDAGASARMVLFKGIDDGAFLFYTDYGSRKRRDLATDRRAALDFYPPGSRHQGRRSGTALRASLKRSFSFIATPTPGTHL